MGLMQSRWLYTFSYPLCLGSLLLATYGFRAPGPAEKSPAAAVKLALPLLQSSAKTWVQRSACTSCHHQSLGSVAIATARARRFPVNDTLAKGQVTAVQTHRSKAILKMFEGGGAINAQAGFSYALLGFAAENQPPGPLTDAMAHFLMLRQARDGGWISESHRPPLEDSRETVTAFAVRGLTVYAPPSHKAESKVRIRRAQQWLLKSKPEQQEGRVMRLLGLIWSKAPTRSIAGAAKDLLRRQRPDGGWQQLLTRESDAYATGQTLVALRLAGIPYNHPALKKGEAFLLKKQLPDGTWRVSTRRKTEGLLYFETGYPHGIDQFISYAGSAWAAIALACAGSPQLPLPLTRTAVPARGASATYTIASDPKANRLFTAIAFGSLAGVRNALDAGADPNARNLAGATPLHWAVFDAEKTRLLLKRGALPDVRTPAGKTPLLIAALVDGGAKSLPLLLQAGADPNQVPPEGPDALAAAILARDAEKIDLLLTWGVTFASKSEFSPLLAAVLVDDTELIRRFRTQVKPADATALLLDAILMGSEPGVRALLEAGAEPNTLDEHGRNALHWAACLNVGSGRLVRLLKKHGADPTLKTKTGETAYALAVANANPAVLPYLKRF